MCVCVFVRGWALSLVLFLFTWIQGGDVIRKYKQAQHVDVVKAKVSSLFI